MCSRSSGPPRCWWAHGEADVAGRICRQNARPASVTDAHAIQDAVTAALGKPVGAFKAMAPANGEATRGVIYADTIHPSPLAIPAAEVPQCGVEGEVAFIFRRDLPARAHPIRATRSPPRSMPARRSRWSPAATGTPTRSRTWRSWQTASATAPSCMPRHSADWRSLELGKLKVTLTVNGAPVLEQVGGHPTGDPLGVAVALANMMRDKGGVRAGQFVTCGSCTGLRYLKPGDIVRCSLRGLGRGGGYFHALSPRRAMRRRRSTC